MMVTSMGALGLVGGLIALPLGLVAHRLLTPGDDARRSGGRARRRAGGLPRLAPATLIFVSSVGAANLALLGTDGAGFGVARFATGFFIAGVYPPALKLISTWYRDGRGAAMGLLVGALTVSSGVPHLVNGLGGLNWRTVIVATSVLTLAGGG
jgi:MFS family permease